MARANDRGRGMWIAHSLRAGAVVRFAARELAAGLGAMLAGSVRVEAAPGLDALSLLVDTGSAADEAAAKAESSSRGAPRGRSVLPDDSFSLKRVGGSGARFAVAAGSESAVLHGAYDFIERLGARFALGRAPRLPRISPAHLAGVEPYEVVPAFARRAFVSDIMTWHYRNPDRLRVHLEHDRVFVGWMAHRGINAFSYIRHAQDTRLGIEELGALYAERGIATEYGGHVLQLLMPRERFAANPEYFPLGQDGKRMERGNLCVSNRAALETACEGAMRYVRECPDMAVLHVWGADVRHGGWCRCGGCAAMSPQLQYMKVVNEIAAALGRDGQDAPAVAYLAYHDTLEPDSGLRPLENVWFEWAPRERCYSHTIDDPDCEVNPRYLDSLRRYMDLFDGRGGVFEYYADAILFGGMGFATPSVIAGDLRAYHRMGLRSVSCLTFGAFSALAYPVNLETFARATRSLELAPDAALAGVAAGRYPQCASAMEPAYRAIARASAMVLSYGEVMRPPTDASGAPARRAQLLGAAAAMREAVAAADAILDDSGALAAAAEVGAERDLWKYSAEVLEGIAQWLEARTLAGADRRTTGERAIDKIGGAIRHVRTIDPRLKGSWGAYDLDRFRDVWLDALRRRLDG